jgi:hypothetical protein
MRRNGLLALILSAVLLLGLAPYLQAQQRDNQPRQKDTQSDQAAVKAGTKLKAELESTVDTRTAKPGDEVVARVTKDVKQDGQTVVRKGDRLKGRITEVQRPQAKGEGKAAAESGSRVAVVFDRLVQGESTSQLNAVLTGVLSTPAERRARQEQAMREEPMMAEPRPAAAPAGGSASGDAGLLGGVGSTVGSVAGAAGSAAGNVAATADSTLAGAGSTLGATTDAAVGGTVGAVVATPAKAIRLDSQAQARNQTGASSVLSTREGHLRLDTGTQLEFRVAGQAEKQAKSG